ncbi:hypothetical protein GCM10011506_21000 [Marivirga lumbricoides]|uniref:CBM6 domain-containing protein n=2 Tax=Marivirga lumbricoides TaxID=1046115 RepID=A0ABQ1M6A0_9BACT|nr:hypothetical protein GCM10011506_21000 [Marivirga lumbricoides]
MVNVLPPTPEAAEFLKRVNIEVNEFVGKPDITIPIHSIQMNDFSWPISLSYDAGGLKVEEVASWVGAGWTLNATGLIGRVVKQYPDELGANQPVTYNQKHGYFSEAAALLINDAGVIQHGQITKYDNHDGPNPEPSKKYGTVSFADSLADGFIDTQPDLYFYSFGKHSGKFYFNHHRELIELVKSNNEFVNYPFRHASYPVELPGEDYYWSIKDDKGLVYEFAKTEKIKSQIDVPLGEPEIMDYQSAWYLTKVYSSSGTLTFNYAADNHVLMKPYIENRKFGFGSASEQNNLSIQRTETAGLRLSSIESSKGDKVEFVSGPDRLDYDGKEISEIKIYKNNELINRVKFHLSYFGTNKKLKLDSLNSFNSNLSIPPYKFEYFDDHHTFPSRNSKEQDFWGYYNGNGAATLIPEYKDDYYHLKNFTADRSPNLYHTRVGALKKLTYPTGGYSEFSYELNEVYDEEFPKTYFHKVVASQGTSLNPNEDEEFFHIPENVAATIELDISPDGIGAKALADIYKKNENGLYQKYYPITDNGVFYSNRVIVEAGDYRLHAINDGEGNRENISISIEYELEESMMRKVGGLRIKSITKFDGIIDNPKKKTNYSYHSFANPHLSSGLLFMEPYFGGYITEYLPGFMRGDEMTSLPTCIQIKDIEPEVYLNVSSYANVILAYQGSHVGYRNVTKEEVIENRTISGRNYLKNGKTQLAFFAEKLTDVYNHPFVDVDYYSNLNGRLQFEKNFSENGSLLSSREQVYSDFNYANEVILINTFRKTRSFCYKVLPVGYSSIRFKPTFKYLQKSISVSRDIHGNEVETSTEFVFDSMIIKPVKSYTIASSGVVKERFYEWGNFAHIGLLASIAEFEYPSADIISANMADKASYRKYYKKFSYQGTQVSSIMEWKAEANDEVNFTANGKVADSINNMFSKLESTYIASFGAGNIEKQHYPQQGDTKKLYQWGYSGSYPIAQLLTSGENEFFKHYNFEADGNTQTSATGLKGMTGQYSISISNVPAEGSYYVSFKAKKESQDVEVSLSGGVGGTINQEVTSTKWQYFKRLVGTGSVESTITISIPSGAILDDVSIYPSEAELTTFTYDVGKGVSSITDTNGATQYFEYDALGRLITKKDDDKNVLSKVYYKYKNQAE